MNSSSRQVNASGMSEPTVERMVPAQDFAIELPSADPH